MYQGGINKRGFTLMEIMLILLIISILIIATFNLILFMHKIRIKGLQYYEASRLAQGIVEELKVSYITDDEDQKNFEATYNGYYVMVSLVKEMNGLLYKIDVSLPNKNDVFNLYGYLGGIYGNHLYQKNYPELPIEDEALLY